MPNCTLEEISFLLFSVVPVKPDDNKSPRRLTNAEISKEGYIPWADSDQLKAARRVLKDMYDSYTEGHPVKLFLQKRAIHNLTQPSGHTNIPRGRKVVQARPYANLRFARLACCKHAYAGGRGTADYDHASMILRRRGLL